MPPSPRKRKSPGHRGPAAGKRTARSQPRFPDDGTPSATIAHSILDQFGDLEPSVRRIMTSGLSENGRMHAIQLFQRSLRAPEDPHRVPAVAIEAGRRQQDGTD